MALFGLKKKTEKEPKEVQGVYDIKVLGVGCKNCLEQYKNAKKAVEELGLRIEVGYITDIEKVTEYGVMSMPALVVNEKIVSMGKVLKPAEIIKLMEKPVEELDLKTNTKLYILTGFLGSGKTTLLSNLIKKLEGHRIAVIQNEFGKIGIDGIVLRNDDIKMVEINRGSIFCTCLEKQFVQALTDMPTQEFEYLFVESSGWGDPSNVDTILEQAQVANGDTYDFRGVICIVDAVNFFEQFEEIETVFRQLKHCHMTVISKTDLVSEEHVKEIEAAIRNINPVCRMERAALGELDEKFLSEDLVQYQWAEAEETTNSAETKPKTLFMDFDEEIEKEALQEFLMVISQYAYRIKGFVRIQGEGIQQVDVVGSRIDFKSAEDVEKLQMVFISKIGPAIIKEIFETWKEKVNLEMKLRN